MVCAICHDSFHPAGSHPATCTCLSTYAHLHKHHLVLLALRAILYSLCLPYCFGKSMCMKSHRRICSLKRDRLMRLVARLDWGDWVGGDVCFHEVIPPQCCGDAWPTAMFHCRCVAYKADERPDLEKDIVPDLTELSLEADTYQGAGQSSAPKGIPAALICPLTQVPAALPLSIRSAGPPLPCRFRRNSRIAFNAVHCWHCSCHA